MLFIAWAAYNIALISLWPLVALRLFLGRIFKGKYQSILKLRLGLELPTFKHSCPLKTVAKKAIWFHAVSVGETKAASSIIDLLLKENLNQRIILSHITQTGYDEGVRIFGERIDHLILPYDFPWMSYRLIQTYQPEWLIYVESDWWVNLTYYAKRSGVKLAIINAKFSDRSYSSYKLGSLFASSFFRQFDRIAAQNEEQKTRFEFLCFYSHPKQILLQFFKKTFHLSLPSQNFRAVQPHHLPEIQATGNIKLSFKQPRLEPSSLEKMEKLIGYQKDQPVVVLSSSHHPEEELFLNAFKRLQIQWPNISLIIAPRHPERFQLLADRLRSLNIEFNQWSQPVSLPKKILLLDAMGKLSEAYSLSQIACVGGTWCKEVGGHNILEPLLWQVPTLYGPHIFKQKEFHQLACQYQLAYCCNEEKIFYVLQELLVNSHKREQLQARAKEFIKNYSSSAEKTKQFLSP
jgi:3-deoxy-D-manno-octulosonic-acid transferase